MGKIHSEKLVLSQLIHLSNFFGSKDASGHLLPCSRVPQRLCAALQIIEAFSHARSLAHPSAPRVHKYIELQFNVHGKIIGAKIMDFMLQKRRVVGNFSQQLNEKSFHIFYDLLQQKDFSKEDKQALLLLDPKAYRFLNGGQTDTARKAKKFNANLYPAYSRSIFLRDTLLALGFGPKTQMEMFKLLSCIMLLGNLEFSDYIAKKEEGFTVALR